MITLEDWNERMWGEYPTLKILLQDKKVPDVYYGLTSASESIFDRIQQLIKISILVREHLNVKDQSKAVDQEKLKIDLNKLAENLESFGDYVLKQKQELREIIYKL